MTAFPDHPFWDFSLAVYGITGVAPACLALQDRHGADVNLLLFACWSAAEGQGALTGARLEAASARVSVWQAEVVAPLRAVRRRLKAGGPGVDPGPAAVLRARLAELELDAEHMEQLALGDAILPPAAQPARPLEDAAAGLVACLRAAGGDGAADESDSLAYLATVLAAAAGVPHAEALDRVRAAAAPR